MADRYRSTAASSRPSAKRLPLKELRNRANTPPVSQRPTNVKHVKAVSSSHSNLPHNESLEPNGTLAIRSSEGPESPAHKRISQISKDDRDSKRNSQISTTSTTASGRRRKCFIGHWQLGKTIGRGGCSRVRVVRHRYRQNQYGAVKIITRSVAESTRAQSLANLIESTRGLPVQTHPGYKPIPHGLEREIAVMRLLEHPNIVRLYDVWENRNELYLIMEYVAGGELFHYVDERKGLDEDEAVLIFRQIVSALLYCHRLLICHRDLKPENILLNTQDLSVKLIDFGMAALQPEGRLLSTPCGSPHYAAPEVVSSKPYDGTRADVWSCGVILYVMLTGTTPYNYGPDGNIRDLFKDITRAKYYLPPGLSLEAKDLIYRIFVADPRKRISMDEVWDHPLLHKYDEKFGFVGEDGTKEAAVGRMPELDEWKVARIQDIDREILRNMRTLWHSESEQSLFHKLLNNEVNQEKLFYAALVKHREENLENYLGDADDISYSASDYHHSRPAHVEDAPPMPEKAQRSQSQYSIMNDEHLRPSTSFVGPPPSMSSYDPYRASKDPIVDPRGEYLNVVVHRNGTTSTRRTSVAERRLRHPHSTRIEMHKQQMHRPSNYSASSLQRSGRSRPSMPRSSLSRHSLTSSVLPSSPPVIATMRPSDLHKRGVSFGHIRRVSTASALTAVDSSSKSSTPATPSLPRELRERQARLQAEAKAAPGSSPLAHMEQPLRSRKEKVATLKTPRIKVRNATETPHQHMRNEVRKHSAELEKACEEAFFRDSFGSGITARTSMTDKPSPYDTPPSSVSAAHTTTPDLLDHKPATRPLPELPKDTPNTYLTRTLEETRKKLEAYRGSGHDNTAKFDEVMRLLDAAMPGTAITSEDRRVVTAPEPKASDQMGFLPIISEEGSEQRSSRDGGNWHRSVTDPVGKARKPEDRTIRMVPPSSPAGTVAPLNVRKRSNGSQTSSEGTQRRLNIKTSAETLGRKPTITDTSGLMSIDEESTMMTPTVVRKKRSGWFGRSKKDTEAEQLSTRAATPDALSRLDDRQEHRQSQILQKNAVQQKALPEDPPVSAVSSEFPIRKHRFGGGKKGFSKWIGRMGREKGVDTSTTEAADTTVFTNQSLDSLFSSQSPSPSSNDAPPPTTGTERSWFARFFNIKPAVEILCFSIRRGRARQDLVILFKEWQRHGIRDLQYSRENNIITARVDRANTLDIKPVTFRVELFVVLEHGRKAGLSIARFVQVKGAVSAFRQVVEVVHGVMRDERKLVEDEEKWRALCEVVGS